MKKTTKFLVVGLVLAIVLGGAWCYTTYTAPLPTVEEAEAAKKVELSTDIDITLEEPEDITEAEPYDYTIEYTPEEPEEEIPEEFLPSVTETVNDDGSVTIDRTWGVKPDGAVTVDEPDGADANMASGGGEIPLDEDGVYQGEQHEETTVTEPVEPEESTTTTTSTSAPSNPSNGDTYYDEDGNLWGYNSLFGGWNMSSGSGGLIEVETDLKPGTGEPVANASWGS